MSTTALPAPGSFAAVLKQSRFATYHPSIGQVYTVFGGHAQRGDWGLKRPLPERKRHRRLKISAVDTREQQSWFDSGESDARTVARWDEIGARVNVDYRSGRWHEQGFTRFTARGLPNIDSEFGGFTTGPNPKNGHLDSTLRLRYEFNSKVFPNIHKMSDAGFEKYVAKIQSRTSQFRDFVQKVEDERASFDQSVQQGSPVSLYFYRNKSHEGFGRTGNDFLELLAEDDIKQEGSRILQPVPHPNGGLSYASPSYLQTRLITPPTKSHVIWASRSSSIAVVGGMTANVAPSTWDNPKQILGVDYRQHDTQRGGYPMRVIDANMQDPPQVVGRRNLGGVDVMKMEVTVHTVEDDSMDHQRANPYPPGSVLYCFSDSGRIIYVPKTPPRTPKPSMGLLAKRRQLDQHKSALEMLLPNLTPDDP